MMKLNRRSSSRPLARLFPMITIRCRSASLRESCTTTRKILERYPGIRICSHLLWLHLFWCFQIIRGDRIANTPYEVGFTRGNPPLNQLPFQGLYENRREMPATMLSGWKFDQAKPRRERFDKKAHTRGLPRVTFDRQSPLRNEIHYCRNRCVTTGKEV